MDPVTAALVAAISAGVNSAAPKLVEKTVTDAYGYLKDLLKRKFGSENEISEAVVGLEKHPDSEGRKATLGEEVQKANGHSDPELLRAALALSEALKSASIPASYSQTATGTNIAQAIGGTASVNVTHAKQGS